MKSTSKPDFDLQERGVARRWSPQSTRETPLPVKTIHDSVADCHDNQQQSGQSASETAVDRLKIFGLVQSFEPDEIVGEPSYPPLSGGIFGLIQCDGADPRPPDHVLGKLWLSPWSLSPVDEPVEPCRRVSKDGWGGRGNYPPCVIVPTSNGL